MNMYMGPLEFLQLCFNTSTQSLRRGWRLGVAVIKESRLRKESSDSRRGQAVCAKQEKPVPGNPGDAKARPPRQ